MGAGSMIACLVGCTGTHGEAPSPTRPLGGGGHGAGTSGAGAGTTTSQSLSCTITAAPTSVEQDELLTVSWQASTGTTVCNLQIDGGDPAAMGPCTGSASFTPVDADLQPGPHELHMQIATAQGTAHCAANFVVTAGLEAPTLQVTEGATSSLGQLCTGSAPWPAFKLNAQLQSGIIHALCTKHYEGLQYGRLEPVGKQQWATATHYTISPEHGGGDVRFVGAALCANNAGHPRIFWRHHPAQALQHLDYHLFGSEGWQALHEHVTTTDQGWLAHTACAHSAPSNRSFLIYREQLAGSMLFKDGPSLSPIPHTENIHGAKVAAAPDGNIHFATVTSSGSIFYMVMSASGQVASGPTEHLPPLTVQPPSDTPYIYTADHLLLDSKARPHVITTGYYWIPVATGGAEPAVDWNFMHLKTIRHHFADGNGVWHTETVREIDDGEIFALHAADKGHYVCPTGAAIAADKLLVLRNAVGQLEYYAEDLSTGLHAAGVLSAAPSMTVGYGKRGSVDPSFPDASPAVVGSDAGFVVLWQNPAGAGLSSKTITLAATGG